MAESHLLGKKGEDIAANYLLNSGYRILFRNWVWGKNEIDIIAEKDNTIVFAEVKTRSQGPLEDPRLSLDRNKQKSIIFAAEGYLRKFNIDRESRFDVIIVISKGDSTEIEHLESAFYPTLR